MISPTDTERHDGTDEAFRRLVEPHRAFLHAHCYRMLGSVHDADDALQETLVRAWRGLRRFEGRSTPRTWLHRIATNTCLDALARRRRRMVPIDHGPSTGPADMGEPLDQSVWVEPYPTAMLDVADDAVAPDARYEARESLELAFVAALQHLPPRQRAALVLKDVLGLSSREIATTLSTTTASVNSALQRARKTMGERLPSRSQQATMRLVGDAHVSRLVERFIAACENGDVDSILELLTEDASFSMPPYPGWCRGRAAIAESWLMPSGPPPRLRYVPTSANAQPAVATYLLDRDEGAYLPIALDVLTLDDRRISAVTAFRATDVFSRFGLPERLPA